MSRFEVLFFISADCMSRFEVLFFIHAHCMSRFGALNLILVYCVSGLLAEFSSHAIYMIYFRVDFFSRIVCVCAFCFDFMGGAVGECL